MKPMLRLLRALLLAAIAGSACGGGGQGPTSPATGGTLTLRLETAHFRLHTDTAPDSLLQEVAGRLEAALPRYEDDLDVNATRTFAVRVWQDSAAWSAEVQRHFGRLIDTAGYVTGPDELRVLAVPQVSRHATHELAHCVSLYVNPRFANNPRWLWESVALWENGDLVDPRTLDYMVAGLPPTLDELNADVTASRQVYEVGYTIGEFVVVRGGPDALVRLIQASGDTVAVLGLSTRQFEEAWYAFVRERYIP
jgi:hypothetical protein